MYVSISNFSPPPYYQIRADKRLKVLTKIDGVIATYVSLWQAIKTRYSLGDCAPQIQNLTADSMTHRPETRSAKHSCQYQSVLSCGYMGGMCLASARCLDARPLPTEGGATLGRGRSCQNRFSGGAAAIFLHSAPAVPPTPTLDTEGGILQGCSHGNSKQ